MTRAPLGGKTTGPNPTDCGNAGVKRSVLTEGHGVPIVAAIAGANRHDMKLVRATIASIVVERPAPTEERPQGMGLDKGADDDDVRTTMREVGFTSTFAVTARKPGRSYTKPASAHGAGSSKAVIIGSIGFAAC
ncbi:MAG: hypothetical protein J7456_15050 [Chloroflexus sp.]|jgi:hypothetical protein|nr:hypothetical protein [Chloroflexus sp.]